MDKSYEAKYHVVELSHWWFVTRREVVRSLVEKLNFSGNLLDIGCASGQLVKEIHADGVSKEQLYGVDISEVAVEGAKEMGYDQCYVMDGADPKFEPAHFEVIVSSDCLEHLEDDKKALLNWYNLLKPGGKAIIFVPAYMFLWTSHDEVNHHYRRYTRKELKTKCKNAGFKVEQSGYWNFFLFFLVAPVRVLSRWLNKDSGDDASMPSPIVNNLFKITLRIENALFKIIRFPFGVSTYVVLEKPKN